MPIVHFTDNLKRHITCPTEKVPGRSVREALDAVFAGNPQLRGYILDDQNRLRQHMLIAIDNEIIHDRIYLSDRVNEDSKIYIIQALSGG